MSVEPVISVAKVFSRTPAGRYTTDGPYSGERFRNEILAPALRNNERIALDLDGVAGYGSSFLEEAFGGLVRARFIEKDQIDRRLKLLSEDDALVEEILTYIREARC